MSNAWPTGLRDTPTSRAGGDLMSAFRSLQASLLAHRPHLDTPTDVVAPPGVPVTVLTGFLGAGKSTLLAALLTSPPRDWVVKAVVNDVGRLPFDPTFLTHDGDLEIELSNGCGCCDDNGDLGATLTTLARTEPQLIVLEASGVADPFALAQVVAADRRLRLDRIVAVMDTTTVERQLDEPALGSILRRQLEAAHVVVLSHADLVTAPRREEVLALVSAMAPGRTIVGSSVADPQTSALVPGSIRGAALPTESLPPGHGVVTVTGTQHRVLDGARLDQALRSLPGSILRCKGVLRTVAGEVSVQLTSAGAQVTPAADTDDSVLVDRHGVTVVGTDAGQVDDAVAVLGCAVPGASQSTW